MMPDKEYNKFLASLDPTMLLLLRLQIVSWLKNPINVYGVTVDGRADMAWDQKRLDLLNAELARRGHPPIV